MNWFIGLFGKKRITVTIYMKSGNSFSIRCTDFKWNHNSTNVTSYSAQGVKGLADHDPLAWIDLNQIERIAVTR